MTMLEDSSAPIANIATGFAAGLRTLRLKDQVVGAGMIVICVDGLPSRPGRRRRRLRDGTVPT